MDLQPAPLAGEDVSEPDEPQRVPANGIEIAYETFGDPADPPLLLVMGLGAQMLAWPDELCRELADAGHQVIRFDNRDVGLSTHLSDVRPPRLVRDLLLRRRRAPYTIDDMADDAVALLDALGIERAHVVGASMGGFIVQTMALRHPQRLRSITLIMTSTGSRRVGRPSRTVLRSIFRRRPTDRDAAIATTVETFRLIGSAAYSVDEEHLRELASRSYDRAYDPDGYLRQVWAINVQPNRTKDLASITTPTLVVHGLHDPLVGVSGGLAVARAIAGSTFVGFSGMGHDLPRQLWPDIARQILSLSATADGKELTADR